MQEKQILDRIKKSEQRVVDLYAKVRDLNTTVYGGGGTQGLKEQYTILQIDPDNDTESNRGKALKDLYQRLKDRDWYGSGYRHTILVPPGNYYFEDGEPLVLDYPGIDVVSLTGEPDVFLYVNYNSDPFALNQNVFKYYEGPNLADANLSFLNIGNNIVYENFGPDSQGIYFTNVDQGSDEQSYPVRFPETADTVESQALYYEIGFIHGFDCSDLGFAIWENGDIPEWSWDSNNTLFKVQINCGEDIEVYGRNGAQASFSTGGLTIGSKYKLIIQIYPDSSVFVGLIVYGEFSTDWVVYNNYSGDFNILAGTTIEAGLAADVDDGGTMHITSLYFPEKTTQFNPCLSVQTDNVTVRGISGYITNSSNWYEWSELNNNDYTFPIFVDEGLNGVLIENCIGGPFSFGADPYFNGNGQYGEGYTFKNCRAPQGYSFGYGVEDYEVTAISCNSLGYDGSYFPSCFDVTNELNVTVIDCRFGNMCFIGYNLYISVKDTEVGPDCFQASNYIEGDFENCKTGNYSFIAGGDIYGTYRNCVVGSRVFQTGNVYADFFNCWFGDADYLNGTDANCYYCYNDQNDGGVVPTISNASYCIDITD